jgi:hypothetical protein
MDIRKILTIQLMSGMLCLSVLCADEEINTVSPQIADESIKVEPLSFSERLFLLSSEINSAFENAMGVLRGTVDSEDLQSSILKLEEILANNPDIAFDGIDQFLDILRQIQTDTTEDVDYSWLDEMENSLRIHYKSLVCELDACIS